MPTTDDPEKFEQRWNEHVDQLTRLKSTLDPEEWDRLEETQEELRALIEEAAVEVSDE